MFEQDMAVCHVEHMWLVHFVKHHVVHDAIGTITDGMIQHVEL